MWAPQNQRGCRNERSAHGDARAGATTDDMPVETVPTPHDGIDGSGFVVEADGRRLGILTDLGHVFDELPDVVNSLDAVMIESNYDEGMLERGPYPWHLKERIRSDEGHLSNVEAAELLRDAAPPGLRWACLSHRSEQNNTPRLALRVHREVLSNGLDLHVAGRYKPIRLPEL